MFIKIALSLVLGYGLSLVICSSKITSKSSLDRFRRQSGDQLTQARPDWCRIPQPLENGRLRPSEKRCRPGNHFPACKMTPGVHVFPNWVLYLDYCNPGYILGTTNDVAACVNGKWLPRLPACVASNSGDECTLSETVANGKAVCRGEVIFEDSFNSPLYDKWRRVVSFPDGNYPFNVLTSDEENSSIRNGRMVITPTLLDEALVTSGKLELKRCSTERNSTYCVRTGSFDDILPPVASSVMNTYDSFQFRYGEVEIRAKLPMGDWLASELVVDMKDGGYGGLEHTGFIRIIRRGNSDLLCGGEDLGHNRVEFYVVLGSSKNKKQKRFFLGNLPDKWHDQYHNYTIIWKPGSISFKVDHEFVGEIAPAGKTLCEDFGFTQEECSPFDGSILSPFDKDFIIGIALSAGNLWFFPDNCISRGKPKPWKNNEIKAKLDFWQDRENWHSTWTKEGSSLYIDHIRVTAI